MNKQKRFNDKNLMLLDGSVLPWFDKRHKNYIDKTIVIYGKRKSGKSTLVDEILYICKDHIPFLYVIAKSASANNPYKNKVPSRCIKSNITKEWLEDFLSYQQNRANIYNMANDPKNLKKVFDKIASRNIKIIEDKTNSDAQFIIERIKRNPNFNYAKKKADINKIKEIQMTQLCHLYRTNIEYYKPELINMIKKKQLTEAEICVVHFLKFKPHTILVFDDCASKLKEWCKKSTTIKEMFYEGRWYYITLIITSHSDKELASELRQNTDISIYTTDQAAICSFNRKSDAYPNYIKKRAEMCVKRVFSNDTTFGDNYKKLVYFNNMDDPFFYTIANLCSDFKMGCPALWAMNEKLEKNEKSSNTNTDFFKKYCGA